MQKYYSTSPKHRLSVLKWFEEDAIEIIKSNHHLNYVEPQYFSPDEKNRLLATNKTIHTFRIEKDGIFLPIEYLREIHNKLVLSKPVGFHLGQPVTLSSKSGESGLRIALGSRLIIDSIRTIEEKNGGIEMAREKLTSIISSACNRIEELANEFGN